MRIGKFIRARTISEAWHRGIGLIWRQGSELKDERGTRIKELIGLQVVVEDTRADKIPPEYERLWNQEHLDEYAAQLLSGENPGFEYTYGERLRAWTIAAACESSPSSAPSESRVPPVDQISEAVRRLRIAPQTRRATAVTWIPPVDTQKEEVPCMIVDDFKLRDGRLNLIVFFRSHDFAGAYPANLYGLSRVLDHVCGEIGAEPGSITTLSASAHIYEHDWDWVEGMLTGLMPGEG